MRGGFVARTGAKGGAPSRSKLNQKTRLRYARQFGAASVENMNPEARCPNIQPTVRKKSAVYVLGSAPGPTADMAGDPLLGSAPSLTCQILKSLRVRYTYDNVCRTLPPDDRKPEPHEIEAFRADVEKSILASGARVVVLMGRAALWWALGSTTPGKDAETVCRGRHWPGEIQGVPIRFVATLDPTYVVRLMEAGDRPGPWARQLGTHLKRDLALAKKLAAKGAEKGFPAPLSASELEDGVTVLKEPAAILAALRRFRKVGGLVVNDLETTALRPYGKAARISTMALTNAHETIAFPFRHPKSGFAPEEFEKIRASVAKTMKAAETVVAHNAPFEAEWWGSEFGTDFLFQVHTSCTLQDAYVLDVRQGALSLNFLMVQHCGVALKELTGVNTKYVEMNPLDDVLLYNGMDTLATFKLWEKQRRLIKARGLEHASELQRRKIRSVVVAQLGGLPISQKEARSQEWKLDTQLQMIEVELAALPEVKSFRAEHGSFSATNNDEIGSLLESIGRDEIFVQSKAKRGEKSEIRKSTEEEVLQSIIDAGGRGGKFCGRILEHRSASKLLGTYIRPLLADSEKSVVWPDGKVHTLFKISTTATSRFSSEGPNVQNYPKRSDLAKLIRKVFKAPKGYVLLSIDYSQLEACVIAMLSGDPEWVRMILEGYDAHLEWAKIVADISPGSLERQTGARSWKRASAKQRKTFRGLIKNQLVFPAFFGAQPRSIAGYLGIEEDRANIIFGKFWRTFSGVKAWQEGLSSEYHRKGYVECGTGRRRYGPITENMIYNTPVQGTAAEIVAAAMARCTDYAWETEQPWLTPRINIHDDLTFLVPLAKVQSAVEQLVEIMTDPVFPFISVPLSVEAEKGPDWGSMEAFFTHTGQVAA